MAMKDRAIILAWIALLLAMVTTFAEWTIDVSVGAISTGGYLTNGHWNASPIKMYHLGLYTISLCTFILSALLIKISIRSKELK
jgi:hypothetical protein